MLRKTKILLFSSAAILLCACVVVGILYSLYTDSVEVKHHLSSGKLDAVLERTYLSYRVPDSSGYLAEYLNKDIVNFSDSKQSESNIFGLGQDVPIIPGSYYESSMKVSNKGDMAFIYNVNLDLSPETAASPLASQLLLSVYNNDGVKVVDNKPLNSIDINAPLLSERMYAGAAPQKFIVRIDFIASNDNNSAQDQNIYFDLSIDAVQDTQ